MVVAGTVLVAACGGDDDDASTATTPPPAAATTSVGTGATTPAADGAFPVTIEHRFGTTTIDAAPQRVVTVGFADQDALLALGVVPVGIRDWSGEQPSATWPWATDRLGDAEPTVLSNLEINFEEITALEPDLIVGISSGMTESDYKTLTGIAPTIAQSDEYIEYGVPWQEGTRVIGQAVGKAAAADALVADVEAQIAAVAAAHPEWAGQEAAVGFVLSESQIGAYASGDPRPALLEGLGLVTPAEFDELAGDQFYAEFSMEEMGLLDRDVLVWVAGDWSVNEQIKANPLRQQLDAAAEGREVFFGQIEAGAFSFSSVLSLPSLLETLVPQLEAALDGDPATEVPTSE